MDVTAFLLALILLLGFFLVAWGAGRLQHPVHGHILRLGGTLAVTAVVVTAALILGGLELPALVARYFLPLLGLALVGVGVAKLFRDGEWA